MAGMLLIALASGEQLPPTTAELVAAGQRLTRELSLGTPTVLLAGRNVQALATNVGGLGVEHVLLAESSAPQPASPEWLMAAAETAVRQVDPDVVLLTHAPASRELAAALAYKLDTGLVTDCTALRPEGGELVLTKPVYGGSAIAEYSISSRPRIATLRPRAFDVGEDGAAAAAGAQPRLEALSVPEPEGAIQVLEEMREQAASGPSLKDSRVVVSGGRGLGGPENWHYIEELAQVLGAAVGATRAVTDAGWVPTSLQVGLTGVTIAPDLYITVGISGAVQHIAGISGARNVVAINRDADANIFKYARYGVVGDWKQILPAFTERLKELRG